MKTVVVVNGPPRAGKDTAIRLMRRDLWYVNVENYEYSSIDPVKIMLGAHVDLSAKSEADRLLLSVVGDALEAHSAFRTNGCMSQIKTFFGATDGVFFLHIREPRLIEHLRAQCAAAGFGFVTVMLDSTRAEHVVSNPSDAGVHGYRYDAHLRNDGTIAELASACRRFLLNHLKVAGIQRILD